MSIDRLIWGVSVSYCRTEKEFVAIIKHLLKTLADYLQQPIEMLTSSPEKAICEGEEKFVCYIRS